MGRPIIHLEPCPFCGAEAEIRTFDRKTYYATCRSCRADSGGYDTLMDAVVAWNRRTEKTHDTEEQTKDRLEAESRQPA